MKPILLKKRRYNGKDILRFIAVGIAHYFFFGIYFMIIFTINYFTNGEWIPNFGSMSVLLGYSVVIGPAVNAVLHAGYAERGAPGVRMMMGLHVFMIIFVVPIAVFL